MSVRRKKTYLNAQALEIIINVHNYFKDEHIRFKNNSESKYFKMNLKRLNKATGVSVVTLHKLLKGFTPIQPKLAPLNVNNKTDQKVFSGRNYGVIRKAVNDTILEKESTVKSLYKTLRESVKYKGSLAEFKKILLDLGFQLVILENHNTTTRLMMEKHEVRLKRIQYLDKIKECRKTGKNIVFLCESVIYTSTNQSDCWITVNAANEKGFIGSCLYYQLGYEVTSDIYLLWLRTQIIPNLSKDSVLVFENGPQLHKFDEEFPDFYSLTKPKMVQWLGKRTISVDPELSKPQLYDLICHYKEALFKNQLDQILDEHGHSALRLPHYHRELNPIEKMWLEVGNVVLLKRIEPHLKFGPNAAKGLVDVAIRERMDMISSQLWAEAFEETIRCENYYRSIEYKLDKYTDKLNCSKDDCDSSDSETDARENNSTENIINAAIGSIDKKNKVENAKTDVIESISKTPQSQQKSLILTEELILKPEEFEYLEKCNMEAIGQIELEKIGDISNAPPQSQKDLTEYMLLTEELILKPEVVEYSESCMMEVAENIEIVNSDDIGNVIEQCNKKSSEFISTEEMVIRTDVVDFLQNCANEEDDHIEKEDFALEQPKYSSKLLLTEELMLKPEVVEYSDEEMKNE